MATRMRRNAESLLVLSGEAPLRRSGEAMAIDDVIRAASGEIEDYLRVQVDNVDPVYVHPSAASDLVHLMAELLENATNFSSPDQMIRIVGVTQVDGSYTISIIDQGIGMSRSEMAEVNDRLIEPSFKDDSPAGLLGLFVVGRLALRHGIDARLVESATAGVTAKLTLPAVIVILEGEVLDGDPVQNLISTLNEMEEPRPAMRAPAHPPEEFRLPRETVATDRQQMPDRMEFERQQSHALEVKVRRRTRTTDDETSDSTSTDGERVQLVDTARREPGPHVRAEPGAARAEQTRQDLDNFASGVEAARKATRPAPGEQPSNAVAGPADPGNEERIGRASRPNRRSTDWEDDHG
jgi:anti-sigma regulatory factor (Ser/Thr protein kinase)